MSSEIIINKVNDIISIYVLENSKLVEMYHDSGEKESLLGNIYTGIVTDVIVGMQAAFVDLGIGKNAFISVKDAMKKVDTVKEQIDSNIIISDVLKKGQRILVQVKKEPIDDKGARVSTHITLPGKYIVLMPETDIITVSQKIEDEIEKERLKNIVETNLPGGFGAIVRTDAVNILEKALKDDIKELILKWENILSQHSEKDSIALLHSDNDIITKTLRDVLNQSTQKIYVNDRSIYERIVNKLGDKICILDENSDLISKFGLETEVSKVHDRKVYLKCGGHIVIDKTEALTAIDVNSGKYTGTINLERTTLKVNLEAAEEIMRQIRLKDIGGIIVIDFIDMHEQEHKEKIIELMKAEAKKDRSKVDVKKFTELNLVELTRKKMYV